MEYLCTSANGKKVYYDPKDSHFATHLSDTPELLHLVSSILEEKSLEEEKIIVEHDSGFVIGKTDLVETTEDDDIVYAKRLNRDTYTRFVKGRQALPTQYITIVVKKIAEESYEVLSAWMGRDDPPFPDRPEATPESKDFWEHHALVWGTQQIQKGTETKIPPW